MKKSMKAFITKLSITLAVCHLAAAGAAFALPNGLADSSTQVTVNLDQQWTGTASGYLYPGTTNQSYNTWNTGYGFNLTYLTSNGQTNTIHEANSFCIDPAEATTNPMTGYYLISLAQFAKSNPGYALEYTEVAWLLTQAMNKSLNWVTAQAAAWDILFNSNGVTWAFNSDSVGDVLGSSTTPGTIQYWINQAQLNAPNFNTWGFYFAVNPDDNVIQSFNQPTQDYLFYDPTPTPEPGTMLLVASTILGLGGMRLRKKILG